MPQTLTVLAPIRLGREAALRAILRPIGDDIRGTKRAAASGPRIEFTRSTRIHFARFCILPDTDHGSDRSRLLYSANFDGSLDDHLAELTAITSDMDAIWGACDGYRGVAAFPAFVHAHAVEPDAYYISFREETVASIRATLAAGHQHGGRVSLARRVLRALPIVGDLLRAIGRCGFANVYRGSLMIIATLNRYRRYRLVNWVTGNRMPQRRSLYSSVQIESYAGPAGFREDVIAQNQLTLITGIAGGRADRVRAVMSAIDSYAKRLSPPGSLVGVSTIHFVKWTIIDGGQRLMMLSDYDGSWESYIDEFAEMILSGLDAIWTTGEGYPPDGARDLPAFKRFLRSHQVPSEVFFSAYPDATVLNINNALQQ